MDAARAFQRDPSRATAIALLAAVGVPIPFASLRNQTLSSRPQQMSRHGGGGNELARLACLARLDVLKDLYDPENPLSTEMVGMVLDGVDFPPEEKNKVLDACTTPWSSLASIFADMFIPRQDQNVIHMKGRMFRIEEDERLYKAVRGWARMGSEVRLVLDGVLRGCNKGSSEDDLVKSLVMFAFLMILLGDIGSIEMSYVVRGSKRIAISSINNEPTNVDHIVFLYGPMHAIDFPDNPMFLDEWVTQVGVLVNWAERVILRQISVKECPAPYDPRFRVTKRAVVVDGRDRIPIRYTQLPRFLPRSTPSQQIDISATHFGVPYNKKYLKYVMQQFERVPRRSQTPSQVAFMRRLMDINFFRDAYYADIAVGMGAVYLTFDRLAYVYFKKFRAPVDAPSLFMAADIMIS